MWGTRSVSVPDTVYPVVRPRRKLNRGGGLRPFVTRDISINMQTGIDSFVSTNPDSLTGERPSNVDRIQHLLEEIELADKVGLDFFGLGEHHRDEFLDSAPAVILAAAAARTKNIRLTSAVTVLSAADPVRVFQEFATLDLISNGRAEIIAGRGSFTESFPLFGLALNDYNSLFVEKLDLLLKLRESTHITWSGRHRAALTGQGVYPRPIQEKLPIWVGVGGTPESFARAGSLGLPLTVAIIGGEPERFRPLIDLYYEVARRAGHSRDTLQVGVHAIGYVADTDQIAADEFFPGFADAFTRIGRERGWPPTTRRKFDALLQPGGALMVGSPATVTAKLRQMSDDLGGLARVSMQMSVAAMPHAKMLHSIQLLGDQVAPALRA